MGDTAAAASRYYGSKLLHKLKFVELINADSLFLHKPHTPNYRKGS